MKLATSMKVMGKMMKNKLLNNLEIDEDMWYEVLWFNVQMAMINSLFSSESTSLNEIKIQIFQNRDECSLSYRLGSDKKSLIRQFSIGYKPNWIKSLEVSAIKDGYKTKCTPPNEEYKSGLLEIWVEL